MPEPEPRTSRAGCQQACVVIISSAAPAPPPPGAPSSRAHPGPLRPWPLSLSALRARRPRLPWPGRTARAAPPGKSKLKTSRKSSSSRRPSERKWGAGRRGWRWQRQRVQRWLSLPPPPSPPPRQEPEGRRVLIVQFSALRSPPRARRVGLRRAGAGGPLGFRGQSQAGDFSLP